MLSKTSGIFIKGLLTEMSDINNRSRAKQLVDFNGLHYNFGILPTDIDGIIEIDDKVYILFELKLIGNELPRGQRLCFERLVDKIGERSCAVLLIAQHEIYDVEIDIPAAECIVIEWRNHKISYTEGKLIGKTIKEVIDIILEVKGMSNYIL